MALASGVGGKLVGKLGEMTGQQLLSLANKHLSPKQKRSIASAPKARRAAMLKGHLRALNAMDSMVNRPGREKISREDQFRSNPTNRLQVAPSGQGYYDAFVNAPTTAVTAMSVGMATGLNGRLRFTVEGHPRYAQQPGAVLELPGVENIPVSQLLTILNGMKPMYPNGMYPTSDLATALGLTPPQALRFLSIQDSIEYLMEASTANQTTAQLVGAASQSRLTDTSRLLLFANFPDNSFGCMEYYVLGTEDSGISITEIPHVVPQFIDSEGDMGIPVRMSVRLRNVTEALAVGGSVRVLRLPTGMETPNNTNDYFSFCSLIRNSVHTVTYSGHELTSMQQLNAYVADQVRCTMFVMNAAGHGSSGQTHFRSAIANPAMTTLAILIDDFAASGSGINNSYEITAGFQRLVRFTPGSTLHSMAHQVPTKDNQAINSHRDATERQGSVLQKVGAGALGMIGPAVGMGLSMMSGGGPKGMKIF